MRQVFEAPARWMDDELTMFDESVSRFFADKVSPERIAKWREDGIVEREAWTEMAAAGLLGLSISPKYGGAGGDLRHEAVLMRHLGLIGAEGWGVPLHNGICGGYLSHHGTEEQRQRWLPGLVSGELITAIAMTEPGAGSDLKGIRTTARRTENGYVLNGQKTFITNGQLADLIIVVAKTDADAGSKGISLIVVDVRDCPGFSRGRNLDKVGMELGDTSELFFEDVHVPAENLLGGVEGKGMYQLMQELPKERLLIAIECMAIIESALAHTLDYVQERRAFGQRVWDFQNTQFTLADCKTEGAIARSFVDECIIK